MKRFLICLVFSFGGALVASAQQGGFDGTGGGAPVTCVAGNNYACLSLGNTFTASQAISAATPTLTFYDTNNSSQWMQWQNAYGTLLLNSNSGYGGVAFALIPGEFASFTSNTQIAWTASTTGNLPFNFPDTELCRASAGVVEVSNANNTSACNAGGTIETASLIATGLVTTPAISSASGASNSDLRGHLTLVGGTANRTFDGTYTVAPTCVASDTTTAAAVKASDTTTVLTLTGTGTDVLNYICVD